MSHRINHFFIFLLTVALLSVGGCETFPDVSIEKDGKRYGVTQGLFQGRWWHYYERGISFAEGGFWKEAGDDLLEAIRERYKDERRARTYRMHFVDYFPHRELGITYFQTGKLTEARDELELSLSQFPSAKAKFYLERVYENLISESKIDTGYPEMTLACNGSELKPDQKPEFRTREDPIVISGSVEDEKYVASIKLQDETLFLLNALEDFKKNVSFRKSLSLSQGRHIIKVEAKNLMGGVTTHEMAVQVDREGPVVTINQLKKTSDGGKVVISGFLNDEVGVSDLLISGRKISISRGKEVSFSEPIIVKTDKVELITHDNLGNRTSIHIPLSPPSTVHTPVLLASASLMTGNRMVAQNDTRPPTIEIRNRDDIRTVYQDRIPVEVQVSDDKSVITGLWVNGKPIRRRQGFSIAFTHIVDLKEGENTIIVKALDKANNEADEEIIVEKKTYDALLPENRLSFLVFPFRHVNKQEDVKVSEYSKDFHDKLIDALTSIFDTGTRQYRFKVIERNVIPTDFLENRTIDSQSKKDLNDALKLGRELGVRCIVTGKIREGLIKDKLGGGNKLGIEIISEMRDTANENPMKGLPLIDAYREGRDAEFADKELAVKFNLEFPLLQGGVTDRRGENISTDLVHDKLRENKRLIVYKEEPDRVIAHARIIGMSRKELKLRAKLLSGVSENIKAAEDKVITE